MSEKQINQIIGKIFNDLSDTLISGEYAKRPRIAVTSLGNEHGEENILDAAVNAGKYGIDVTVIGTQKKGGINTIKVQAEQEAHKVMENLLESDSVDAAVTMHYPFPIGVSTIGRIITPGKGKEMFIAATTGTSSTDRIESMVKNTIYGIITAKACGIKNPSVGLLNVDGAKQTEIILKKLHAQGYNISFAQSQRSDGGAIMRGNDLLMGSADVMVMDSLTGNLMIKILSSFTTGGNYESLGYGYGPGVGVNFNKLIMIISRASGTPVVEGALKYAAELIKGNFFRIAEEEYSKAERAGLYELLNSIKQTKHEAVHEEIMSPDKEVVTSQISGIEIMDLEDAVKMLWRKGIYAESGMGCTGPIVLVNEGKIKEAIKILAEHEYIPKERTYC